MSLEWEAPRLKLLTCTQHDVDAILARLRSVRDGQRRP